MEFLVTNREKKKNVIKPKLSRGIVWGIYSSILLHVEDARESGSGWTCWDGFDVGLGKLCNATWIGEVRQQSINMKQQQQ